MRNKVLLACFVFLFQSLTAAAAQTSPSSKAHFAAESKKIAAAYEADKKLCNDETSSKARLQCRRDAKADYDKSLAAAQRQMNAPKPKTAPAAATASPAAVPAAAAAPLVAPVCADCGKVTAITTVEKAGDSGPLGVIAGGAAGAILGHQVGGGTGKDLATIAGALGGAYAGKKIEGMVKTQTVWTVSVQYADGRKANFEFQQDPGMKVGDSVKSAGASIVRE
jgi:outer membrane lipoprotein SlyB